MARESAPRGPVSRRDIEAKLREIKGEVDDTTKSAIPYALAAGVVAVVGVVALAYVMGRRKGRKKSTVVKIGGVGLRLGGKGPPPLPRRRGWGPAGKVSID